MSGYVTAQETGPLSSSQITMEGVLDRPQAGLSVLTEEFWGVQRKRPHENVTTYWRRRAWGETADSGSPGLRARKALSAAANKCPSLLSQMGAPCHWS